MKAKLVSESAIHDQTYVVFPDDLNPVGTIFGGAIVALCDRLAGVVARRHAGTVCVTLGIDAVRFLAPAMQGDVLIFKASVNRVWHTSMEIGVTVEREQYNSGERDHIVSAFFTFVGVNRRMRPVKIPQVIPKTAEEKRRYKEADERRQARLAKKVT